jgi:O-succinylbenzoate synthase
MRARQLETRKKGRHTAHCSEGKCSHFEQFISTTRFLNCNFQQLVVVAVHTQLPVSMLQVKGASGQFELAGLQGCIHHESDVGTKFIYRLNPQLFPQTVCGVDSID